jgi:hypothetical protein
MSGIPIKIKKLVPGAAFLSAIVAAILVFYLLDREDYSSVCVKTGMVRHCRNYGPLMTRDRIEPTALSQVLVETGFRNPADHHWVYAHGRGRDILGLHTRFTASGSALTLPGTLASPQVASTFRLLIAYTDKTTVEKWLQRAFDTDFSPHLGWYLLDVDEHTNKEEFIRWLSQREDQIAEMEALR